MMNVNIRNTKVGDKVIAFMDYWSDRFQHIVCKTPMTVTKITCRTMQAETADGTRAVFYRHSSYYGTYYTDTWSSKQAKFGKLMREGA